MAKQIKRSAEAFRYTLVADRQLEPTEQTVFTLNPLTAPERRRLVDESTVTRVLPDGTREIIERARQQAWENVRSHIVSVENFPVGQAKLWPKSRDEQDAYLNEFEEDAILEMHNELFRRSWLGDDVKNSLTPEPMSSSGAP